MPRYRVTLEGHLVEVWKVEAASPLEADERVRHAKGHCLDQRWADNPETTKIEKVESARVDPP